MPVSLVRILMQLTDNAVKVELKNGSVVSGTIVGVDPQMNTHLKDVKVTMKDQNPTELDSLSIRGGCIRFFSLPETVNIDNLLTKVSATKEQLRNGTGFSRGGRGGRGGWSGGGRGRGRGGPSKRPREE